MQRVRITFLTRESGQKIRNKKDEIKSVVLDALGLEEANVHCTTAIETGVTGDIPIPTLDIEVSVSGWSTEIEQIARIISERFEEHGLLDKGTHSKRSGKMAISIIPIPERHSVFIVNGGEEI